MIEEEIKTNIKKIKKDIFLTYLGIAFFMLFIFSLIIFTSIIFVNTPSYFNGVKISNSDKIFVEKFQKISAPIIFVLYIFIFIINLVLISAVNKRLEKINKLNYLNYLSKYKTIKVLLIVGIFISIIKIVAYIMLFLELNNEMKKILETPSDDFIKKCMADIDKEIGKDN